MDYREIGEEDLHQFRAILGQEFVVTKEEVRREYGKDETEDLSFPPDVILRPRTTEEVSELMRYCSHKRIPVTPIGARTGLSGGALSVYGGVGLSMERFNSILNIDTDNLQATVEPGVITEVFQNAVEEKGLFYPPDPASKGSCFIGGNLAESSGGPKAVKYGVTKDYVLNLEIVLPNGEIMWTGANVLKNATGYDLTSLMVGSEGTLALITKAVFKLLPKPKYDVLLLVPFKSAAKACECVPAIFKVGVTPSGMEFMERDALVLVNEFMGNDIELPREVEAHLLIELDGNDLDRLMKEAETIYEVLEQFDAGEILFAESAAEKARLWAMRRKIGEAVKSSSIYKEEDTVVPRYELPRLLSLVKRIGAKYGFQSVCYGHAGDGNLHVNILKGELDDHQWSHELNNWIRELFEGVAAMGGTISGEHGIGVVQKEYLDIVFGEHQIGLMKAIKEVFDPRGIMNPGKVF